MKPALCVESVSKRYTRNRDAHGRHGLADWLRALFGGTARAGTREDEFYALQDVSFALEPGDTLGVIGRNGSGKTTLLRLLTGLVRPDAGRILIRGRVQALIALGAGFDTKLSGRENVYNSASLMGLSRAETDRIYEDIIDFAELGSFIDSPVETYSSGMFARLGFSTAIHLQPDVLLIDEILAVGDIGFQNKCFAKLYELKQRGATIVLVSHNHTQISQLCDQAIWLHEGSVRAHTDAKDCVQQYLTFIDEQESEHARRLDALRSDDAARETGRVSLYGGIYDELDEIEDVDVSLFDGESETTTIRQGDDLRVRYSFSLKRPVNELNVSLSFWRTDGLHLTTISTLNGDLVADIHEGRVACEMTWRACGLHPGDYVLVMPVHEGHSYLYRDIVARFRVVSPGDRMTWGVYTPEYDYAVTTNGRTYSSAGDAKRADESLLPK